MAYCNECGAYIPDGHSKCLACGVDMNAKTDTAYEYKETKTINTEFLKKQLEQQRRRQQENNRKWAETEKAQREKAQSQNRSYSSGNNTYKNNKSDESISLDSSKILSAMSYFGLLFVIPYIISKNDDFALFHAKQGMILFLACLLGQAAASLLGLGWIVSLARIYFIYKGVSAAIKGRKEKLPYIGGLI